MQTARESSPVPEQGRCVHLLGQFRVQVDGRVVELPASTHRLVAFLALRRHPVERSYLSACLWLDKSDQRAAANLRSVLWRLRQLPVPLVAATSSHLALEDGVAVDTDAWTALVRALLDDGRAVDVDAIEVADLATELLPSWYDDFVELERERFWQLRLHALEAFARRLSAQGRHARALDAALAAVAADPLRESAHRAVMAVHLDEGNPSEAVRQYRALSEVLGRQLGIRPSARSRDLVAEHLVAQRGPVDPRPAVTAGR